MTEPTRHAFQAEVAEVLNLVVSSLYSNKEVFLRELVSNAADACEKLRFRQSSGQAIFEPDKPPGITVKSDEKENTLTIADTGIGMTHAELIENLGTIAHSGTKAFLKQLAETQKADAKLIDSLMDLSDKFAGASRSQLVRMAVKEFIERHGCN